MLTRRSILVTPAALSLSSALAGRAAALSPSSIRPHSEMASLFISLDRVLIMVRSAGGIPMPMLFDTGTSGNAADPLYATALGLQKTGDVVTIDGATGKPLDNGGFLTVVPDVSMSGVRIGDQPFSIYERSATNEIGIVGPYVFGDRLVLLELAHDRLRIRDKTPFTSPSSQAYPYLDDDRPGIHVEGPGFSGLGLMDSGASGTLHLPLEMAASLPLEEEPIVVGQAISVSGPQPIYAARVKGQIKVGPLTLTNPTVGFSGVRIRVGYQLLRQMTVVMDPVGKRSWASVPSGRPASALADYAGIYGPREIRELDGHLGFLRPGHRPRLLIPYDNDLFNLEGSEAQVQFVRSGSGVIGYDIVERTVTQFDRTG